jgi:hypothetical protein
VVDLTDFRGGALHEAALSAPAQAAKVAALKSAASDFVTMRGLAMRFRDILRGKNVTRFEAWLNDAQRGLA